MIDDSTVILISYPSGGFGNFLYHALTEYSSNTIKVPNTEFGFNAVGNSHQTKKYTNIYSHDPTTYELIILDYTKKTLVLCDNGINNDSYDAVRKIFPTAQIIRATVNEAVRPIVYQTCTVKASQTSVLADTIDTVKAGWIDHETDYAVRENFTLLYHNWMFKWEPIDGVINLNLEHLITNPVRTLTNLISNIGGNVINNASLVELCHQWTNANSVYFEVYFNWIKIEQALNSGRHIALTDITSLHDQGYLNYCIEQKFNITIPVYDYRNWFTNTNDIAEAIISINK